MLVDIKNRLKQRLPVSDKEKALLIANDSEALAAFMIDNNPGAVNNALRKMGYSHLGFKPDRAAITRQLQIFIDRKNSEDFKEVLKNFKVNRETLTDKFLNELQTAFLNKK